MDHGESTSSSDRDIIWPLTKHQRKNLRQQYIDSIDREAIRALASRHNHGKSCTVAEPIHGSFNVCFIVDFPQDTKWVVRIPIEPVVRNAWDKLESEVATMQYIREKTKIPLPQVHTYGRDKLLSTADTEIPFLILDYVPGRLLSIDTLKNCKEGWRKRFFRELIQVFVQLWTLKFPKAGSLIPDPNGREDPIVGRVFSITLNSLYTTYHDKQMSPAPFQSATEFINHRFDILSRLRQLPQQDLSLEDAELDLYALDGLKKIRSKLVKKKGERGPFVLNHMDLRCGNIIVDDELRIQAIIDWEWASTVPQQLFAPPAWITGHDPDYLDYGDIPYQFWNTLHIESRSSTDHGKLAKHWCLQQNLLPLVQILQYPSDLSDVYYDFIHVNPDGQYIIEVVSRLCKADKLLALATQEWTHLSERYTAYLKANGLYIADDFMQEQLQIAETIHAHDECFPSRNMAQVQDQIEQ